MIEAYIIYSNLQKFDFSDIGPSSLAYGPHLQVSTAHAVFPLMTWGYIRTAVSDGKHS